MSYNFLCFDTEDDSKELGLAGKSMFDKRVTQIAAITAEGKHYYNKGDVPHFKKWLQRQPEKYIYALNIQYDLGNLFADKLDELDCTMVGGRIIKAVWGNKIFVDVFNIWPMSVKKLGEAFGLAKLETDSMATDKSYVFRDVEIIREAMLFAWGFVDSLGLRHLPPTLGGLCIKVWQHWGGSNCHDSGVMSREALFGGRVELFKVCDDTTWKLNAPEKVYSVFNNDAPVTVLKTGAGRICWTDLNSLYPFVMTGEFPDILEAWSKRKLPKFGVVRATIKQPETDLAVLPVRGDDGRILYPWGTFCGTWTIAEVKAAVERGASILKIHEVNGTNDGGNPYKIFVEKLYQARLTSKSEAEKLFFKLLMNNLYGRLGASGKIGRSVWQNDENKFDGVPYGDKVMVEYSMPLSDETNWCHAAHVTAFGRLELFKYLEKVGTQRLIYCDTDSTIFDCPSRNIPFSTGAALGEMKLESWERAAIPFAPKMYKVGKTYKAKGVPKKYAREFIERGRAEFDLPFKFREAIRFFDRGNTHKLSVWRRVSKQRQTGYDRKKLIGNRFFPCKVCNV